MQLCGFIIAVGSNEGKSGDRKNRRRKNVSFILHGMAFKPLLLYIKYKIGKGPRNDYN